MDSRMRKKLGLEEYESRKIHYELFKTTSEYKYYQFGFAGGLFAIYSALNRLKNTNKHSELVSINELMDSIKNSDYQEKEINEMLNRLIRELESDE